MRRRNTRHRIHRHVPRWGVIQGGSITPATRTDYATSADERGWITAYTPRHVVCLFVTFWPTFGIIFWVFSGTPV